MKNPKLTLIIYICMAVLIIAFGILCFTGVIDNIRNPDSHVNTVTLGIILFVDAAVFIFGAIVTYKDKIRKNEKINKIIKAKLESINTSYLTDYQFRTLITDILLGENYTISDPVDPETANRIILEDIIKKYKDYIGV